MEVKLGKDARDRFTGFKGLVTGEVHYLTGCTQFLIQPRKLDDKGKPAGSEWFDVDRLESIEREPVRAGSPGGPGRVAPKR